MWKWSLKKCCGVVYNSGAQFESAEYFDDLQSLADHFNIPIIYVFSTVGHEKWEVDCVSSLAKCAIRPYVGNWGNIFNATDCTNFLQQKLKEMSNSAFVITEITQETLESKRADAQLKNTLLLMDLINSI